MFGAICRTCQNRPCSKPWAIAQGFCSKSANFRALRIHPKSTGTVVQGVKNQFGKLLEPFQSVWSDLQNLSNRPCSKPWAIAQAFCSKSANFRALRIHPKSTGTVVQGVKNQFGKLLEPFQSVWSDLQNLSNRPCSKPWAIAQAFCSKSANFRALRIHPKSTGTVVQGVKNQFGKLLEPFQSVWSDLQNLSNRPCSKPWAIAQAFCSKSANVRAWRIHPKSTETVVQGVKNQFGGFWNRFREFGAISRTCQNRPCSKPWAIAQAFCSKSANFRAWRIHPKSTGTVVQGVKNQFGKLLEPFQSVWSDLQNLSNRPCSKPWAIAQAFCSKSANFRALRIHPKSTGTVVQGVKNQFGKLLEPFQSVWSDLQNLSNRPCSKPWAIAQAFCSKSGNVRAWRIHPKLTETVVQGVKNQFGGVLEPFQRIWSDFQDLSKSAMFKTMGYSPGFLLKIGQFSSLANSPEVDGNSRASS